MRSYFVPLSLAAATFLAVGCGENKPVLKDEDGLAAFSADSLGKNIEVLASDSFLGRMPFTKGEDLTIDFLQKKFAAVGLEPGNGDSYLQDVPLVNIKTTAAPDMQVNTAKGNFKLKGLEDYVIWTNKTDSVSLNNSDLVFAGYGVVAPEYNWNDYEGIDVKGKVVLVLVNDPGYNSGDSTLFKGKTMTYYGRWTYKFEEAARQGARGCLIIHNTQAASYPFAVVQNNWNGSRLRLDPRGKDEQHADVIGWISGPAANKLLTAAGYDSTLLAKADQRGFKAVPLNEQLTTSISVQADYNKSHNVIGKITGAKRPNEYIIYTAHWDHLGVGKADEKGDSIYNGAMDNASATAGLIEIARAFKSLPTPPERTIILLAVTAEEQGLLGSEYYAQNPIYPVAQTVANINMDVLNPFGKTADIIVVGRGQSDLEDYLQEAATKAGRHISYETHPEAGYYYRSDHFNFAKVGIPALYTERGIDVVGKGKEYGEQLDKEYNDQRYHRPADNYDAATWTMEGAIDDLQLLFQVGKRLAFETRLPEWKKGSEFKAIRDKSLAQPAQ
ncbi:M28 family metallopeptidase [Pseudobacter ginsenosidimutans]|uniref:Zn-dependent M28 family amino/carboxypeptidase n=1 Tax=Pseudobacter ginsenosidimutans TaxID=661488 RepID=A0A4Q7MX87_9BACT|nr:M28 family metallopeptidase [Pseudobacter ginsenosidimutans]QEC41416.1 M28 family peptidase [Pseudobacter ginsenosidimutans]RZS71803.1 Zn-dependent M28 family amino/carboxypeptidase [Pseudobacter ginsenosidimutans]